MTLYRYDVIRIHSKYPDVLLDKLLPKELEHDEYMGWEVVSHSVYREDDDYWCSVLIRKEKLS